MSDKDLSLVPVLDEPETLDDIAAELDAADDQAAQSETLENLEAEKTRRADSLMHKLAIQAPAFATNNYWAFRKIGQLTPEQYQMINALSEKAMSEVTFPDWPWLKAIEDWVEKNLGPFTPLLAVILAMTIEQEKKAKAERAKNVTPSADDDDE